MVWKPRLEDLPEKVDLVGGSFVWTWADGDQVRFGPPLKKTLEQVRRELEEARRPLLPVKRVPGQASPDPQRPLPGSEPKK